MKNFEAENIINGRFFSLWINGDKKAEVKAASAESSLKTEEVPIAGRLGSGVVITGVTGTGTLTFNKVYGDINKAINANIKKGKPFVFDLISELNDPNQSGKERIMIENCVITKFKPIDADITKLLESAYDFSFNPDDVTYE
ncbi:MAG: phage tail tube protein [Solirubrobacterales bacterium]